MTEIALVSLLVSFLTQCTRKFPKAITGSLKRVLENERRKHGKIAFVAPDSWVAKGVMERADGIDLVDETPRTIRMNPENRGYKLGYTDKKDMTSSFKKIEIKIH